ncbi:MAG: hypothetical protein IK024_12225 [Treponema sp.]|nr:hypothetical protein [Treponema sp.]
MMKKGLFVLIAAVSFLFYSCGSTKQNTDANETLEPEVQAEEVLDSENTQEAEQEEEQAQNSAESEIADETSSDTENIDELYPPLDEIEDPELIDISPEEIEAQAAAAQKEAEQNENQITEPVVEEEELPPLPEGETVVSEENPADTQAEGLTDETTSEAQENIEPTIEIQTEEETEPEPEILPSRSVTLKKGETLVITYPGSGWIYMGSTSEYNNLASRGRKLGTTDTKYTLLAKEAGTQIHHFYKVDNLTGEYIDDYIEVTVLEKKGSSSTVVNAPDYSQVVPKKPETPAKATPKATPKVQTEEPKTTSTAPEKSVETKTPAAATPAQEVIEVEAEDTVIVIDEDEPEETLDLAPILEKARSGVSSKKYDDAYLALTQYLEFSTDNRDEALFLLGQVLESDSKYKDIKKAVETYQTLCDSYPASKYWDQANKRIVYLKRFYINIH